MKILCIADHRDPLIYSNRIKERFKDIDFVLSAGDLDLDFYGFIVSSLNKPLFFVFGNHNLKRISYYRKEYANPMKNIEDVYMAPSFGSTYIGGKVVKHNDLLICGLGGSFRYNKGPNQFTERGMYFYMLKLIPRLVLNKLLYGRYVDILVTHAPPYGIHDREDICHRGFEAFKWFMKKFKPRFLIHGHVHLYDRNAVRKEKYENTIVINAYDHIIIDTEKDYE